MKWMVLAVWACGTFAAAVPAQPPARPTAPPAPAGDAALLDGEVDQLLRSWHERTQKIRTLWVKFTRIQKDAVFRGEVRRDGVALFMAPNLARMEIFADLPPAAPGAPAKSREADERFILTKTDADGRPLPRLEVWHYVMGKKEIKIFEVPDDRGQNLQDDGPLKLMFGVNPQGAHARYDFKILQRAPGMVRVRIAPKLAPDREEFLWTDVWLDLKTYLPRVLTVQETPDDKVTYDFPEQARVDHEIAAKYFRPVRLEGFAVIRPEKSQAGAAPAALRPVGTKRP